MKKEKLLKLPFLLAAWVAVLIIFLIFLFVTIRRAPLFFEVSFFDFLTGLNWDHSAGCFGAFPLIYGSFLVAIGALFLEAPLGVEVAIFIPEIALPNVTKVVRPAVELLAGIPSVVYGFFGLMVIVPTLKSIFGGSGYGLVAGSLVLSVMILPTITTLTEDALRSIPRAYRMGFLALGATKWETTKKVVLPSAFREIVLAVFLGMERAISETRAVLMVIGNAPVVLLSLKDQFSNITSIITIDMSYASGMHQQALFALGLVLFIISMLMVALVHLVSRRRGTR